MHTSDFNSMLIIHQLSDSWHLDKHHTVAGDGGLTILGIEECRFS